MANSKTISYYLLMIVGVFTFTFTQAQHTSKKKTYTNTTKYNKDFELIHTKLAVSFDIPNELLYGEEWVQVRPYFYDANTLTLDAKGMQFDKVSVDGVGVSYEYDGEKINLKLNKTASAKDTLRVYLKYTANPARVKQAGSAAITSAKGLYFINSKNLPGEPVQVWTQGETEASSCWFPTIDSPSQKTTQEITITVADKFTTLSNGILTSQTKHSDGTRSDYWVMKQKHAPYLFFMGVGEFAVYKDNWRGKEVAYYTEKEYAHLAESIFGKTPKMMDFFSQITGVDYPWDKYNQVVVREFVSGAMENTTAVAHSDKAYQSEGELIDENAWEAVIAHELFHHWFGDLVTSENWSNISLNESFANYSEYLWFLHEYGYDKAEAHRIKSIEAYKNGNNQMKNLVRFDYENREDVFDLVSYNKGGAVLHMLKYYIGEEAFFKGLHLYLKENAYKATEVPQLRMVFEKVSGKDLTWFFQQWFNGSGHPEIRVSKDYNTIEKTLTITLRQLGKTYYFPIKIDIYEDGQKKEFEFFVDAQEKAITVSYDKYPDWIHVDANHILLAEFIENYTLEEHKFILKNAPHYNDRKKSLKSIAQHQTDKKMFDLVVDAMDDTNYEVQVLALENIDLSGKYAKRKVIDKIEYLAKNSRNNFVKAAAIEVLGKLVYFDYQSFFEKNLKHPSNRVVGASLEALYYLEPKIAVQKASTLPGEVKKTIAYPLSKIYISEKKTDEMVFVSKYIIQGMFLSNDDATKTVFKNGFDWVSESDNLEAYKNLTRDMVQKGKQYKKYNFDKEVVRLLRKMAKTQDKNKGVHKKEILEVINASLNALI